MALKKTKYDMLVELLADWADGGRLDLLIDAIKLVTDQLPDAGALTTIQADLDDPDQYKANVAALATAAALTAHDDALTTAKAVIDAIKLILDTPANFMADVSALALEATLNTHDTALGTHDTALTTAKAVIDAIKLILDTPANFMADVSGITAAGPTNDQMDAAIALCAQIADGWDADLATILDNFNAARIGYLDTLNTGILLGSRTAAFEKLVGIPQIAQDPIDLNSQGVGSIIIFTGKTQDLIIERLIFRSVRDLSGDAGFTGISIETDDATEQVFISQANGVKANITAASQLAWTGAVLLKPDQTISLQVYGGAVAASESLCTVTVECRAVVSGGYLNPE